MMQLVRNTRGLCLVLLATVVGCGPSAVQQAQRKLVGKWDGDLSQIAEDALKQKGGDNPLAGAFGKMMLDMAKPKLEFEFTADGKMSYSASMMGNTQSDRGTWRVTKVEGNFVTLAGKMDKDAKETENTVTIVDDDTLEMSPPAGTQNGTKIKFRRVKQS
jgi:hypothetical protein